MRADFLVTSLLFLGLAVAAAVPEPQSFEVYHYQSEVDGTQFREVFVVTAVTGDPLDIGKVQMMQNGQPLQVTWISGGPNLAVGDQFHFTAEAFDQKSELTAIAAGKQAMSCLYGGGAGLGIHPDEWRDLGYPGEIRCLTDRGD